MNIFVLDSDLSVCAQYHEDRHVIKMPLEGCEMLGISHLATKTYTSFKDLELSKINELPVKISINRVKSHLNHPCSIWVRESVENYLYLTELCFKLLIESSYRFERKKPEEYKSWKELLWYSQHIPAYIPNIPMTDFRLAVSTGLPEYAGLSFPFEKAIEIYRQYYCTKIYKDKKPFSWKKRETPEWYSSPISEQKEV